MQHFKERYSICVTLCLFEAKTANQSGGEMSCIQGIYGFIASINVGNARCWWKPADAK